MAFPAASGAGALSQLRPDIIISDIRMGEFSGLDFIAGVRKLYPEIQILIISGYNDFEYARRAIELGVKRYLLKPIRHKQLLEALGEMEKNVKADEEERRRRAFSRDAARQSVMADALVSGVVDARMKLQMRLAGLMHLLGGILRRAASTCLSTNRQRPMIMQTSSLSCAGTLLTAFRRRWACLERRVCVC